MMEFQPRDNELQMRIDALPPLVRGYMALEFTLGSLIRTEEEKTIIQGEMTKLVKVMKPEDRAHLLMHKNWIERRKNGKIH